MMRRALVTGGAGFIGSHLVRRLLADGWGVDIVDNLSTGFETNVPAGAGFLLLDVSKPGFTDKLGEKRYDAVFHLAAQSSGEVSFDDPVHDLNTNCVSTVTLLEWCRKRAVGRFIYTCSMSIYGDQEAQPVGEDAVPAPKSFYGVGKLASERYIDIYSRLGVNATSLRLFNVYGPGQNMGNMRQGMVSIYMAYILENKRVVVKGSPERYRDFVYIDDVIDAYMACIDAPVAFGKAYNVASGRRVSVRELLDAEMRAFKKDPSTYPVSFEGGTPGDTHGIYARIDAIGRDLGWKPRVGLDEGLGRMAAWASSAAGAKR